MCTQPQFPLVHKESLCVCVCARMRVNAHTSENVLLFTLWPTLMCWRRQCTAALRHAQLQWCLIKRFGVTFIYFNFLSCQTHSSQPKNKVYLETMSHSFIIYVYLYIYMEENMSQAWTKSSSAGQLCTPLHPLLSLRSQSKAKGKSDHPHYW